MSGHKKRAASEQTSVTTPPFPRKSGRLLYTLINTKDQTIVNEYLSAIASNWKQNADRGSMQLCSSDVIDAALEVIADVIGCYDLRLKQIAFFMALNMTASMRDYVCCFDRNTGFLPEPSRTANLFFQHLSDILNPIASEAYTQTNNTTAYTSPEDRMRCIAVAYSVPTCLRNGKHVDAEVNATLYEEAQEKIRSSNKTPTEIEGEGAGAGAGAGGTKTHHGHVPNEETTGNSVKGVPASSWIDTDEHV